MRNLKLSTARDLMIFMTDSTDHITGKAGLTLTITASKNGGAFASISPTVTERGDGWYSLALTTSHTDTLGDLAIRATGTGADPTDLLIQVVTDLPGATVSSVTGSVGSVASGGITAASLDTDCITAAKIAADAGSEIASAVRTELTTELNRIDAAVTTRLSSASYTAPLDAAGTRTALGMASANLDTQIGTLATAASLATVAGYLDTEIAAILEDTGTTLPAQISSLNNLSAAQVTAAVPTAAQNAAAILAAGDVDGYTLEQTLKLCLAALAGKLSGAAGTTVTIRAADDSKTRITATVDSNGNRSAVTLDAAG